MDTLMHMVLCIYCNYALPTGQYSTFPCKKTHKCSNCPLLRNCPNLPPLLSSLPFSNSSSSTLISEIAVAAAIDRLPHQLVSHTKSLQQVIFRNLFNLSVTGSIVFYVRWLTAAICHPNIVLFFLPLLNGALEPFVGAADLLPQSTTDTSFRQKRFCSQFSPNFELFSSFASPKRDFRVFVMSSVVNEASNFIPAAPIFLPEGPWKQIPGGVTAAEGFKAAGMYGGLRALGPKPDLALVTCDVDAVAAGMFTKNVVAAAPVIYCKSVLEKSKTARAVLINAGQANAATGDAGFQDVIDCSNSLAKLLQVRPEEILIESTGVIGQRIKKEPLLSSLPKLISLLSPSVKGADSAAVAITTTDLVSKSVAVEFEVGDSQIRIGGMAKGSGMIHPNMGTLLGVITTDALVDTDVWRKMVQVAVNRSFNQITVDGDTSTNDTIIALASGLSGSKKISELHSSEARQLQTCLDAVMQGLAKSIAWDGEGATCLIEVTVTGAGSEAEAAKIARSVASSSLTKAAVYGRDPNWGRIACAAGYAGIPFDSNALRIALGDILLMDGGQPLSFDRSAASNYLKQAGDAHGTVKIDISIGDGPGKGLAWGCDLSYDYVKINAEYTT